MDIFTKDKSYFLEEIISICDKNALVTVDCLKDEKMISIEEYNDGELGDCIFEFKQSKNNLFELTWVDKNHKKFTDKTRKQSTRI